MYSSLNWWIRKILYILLLLLGVLANIALTNYGATYLLARWEKFKKRRFR